MRYRKRHIEGKLKDYSRFFKTVLVVGARQVGKSSLLEHVFPDIRSFVFDATQDIHGVRSDPDLFLDNFPPPLILDEIQHVPELLSAIKRRVDQRESAGQYLMTGSQNFSVLRKISESLAGRVGILHLDGMTPAEIYDHGTEEVWLEKYLRNPEEFWKTVKCMETHETGIAPFLWKGTLPGLLDAPEDIVPGFMRSYVETYVERDIRVLGNINDLSDFGRFLRLAAALSGCEINASQLGREIGVNPKTARHWLRMLEHSFQWLELAPYHGNTIKRISRKPTGHFRDTGLASYLMGISSPEALSAHPMFGRLFESWTVCWLSRLSSRISVSPAFYHWRTTGGAEVDVVLERDGFLYPIEIKCKTTLSGHDTASLRAFRDTYGKTVKRGVIIYAGREFRVFSDLAVAVPWTVI